MFDKCECPLVICGHNTERGCILKPVTGIRLMEARKFQFLQLFAYK